MLKSLSSTGLMLAICLTATPVGATVAPLTPAGRLMLERKDALENAVRARLGDGTLNQLRDMYGSIVVGKEEQASAAATRVLGKDEHGWFELEGSCRRKLSERVAHELNRLLAQDSVWSEAPYSEERACRWPRLFIVRYAGQELFGRQCAASGLSGRAAQVAATLRIPSGRAATTTPPPPANDPRPGSGAGESFSRHISNRAAAMVWAWERGSLAGAVDPYAEDVIVELPDRILRGKRAVVEWMRPQQQWTSLGVARSSNTRLHQYYRGELKPPHNGIVFEKREIRWEAPNGPMRRTFSATWQNNDGLWEIVHERVSEDKPVTGERQIW